MCEKERVCVVGSLRRSYRFSKCGCVCVCVCVDKMSLFLEGGSDDREIGRGFKMKSMMALFFFSLSPLSLSLSLFPPPVLFPVLARSLVFFPSLNLLYRKFKNKMEQGRERARAIDRLT